MGRFVRPGDPEASPLFRRFHRDGVFLARMPPVATETVDPAGLSLLQRWIQGV
ncbi:hypothetical protein [Sorangium sp. So ce426]|uniref:hypothetical protein n=1 Tax=Sorangium sp. So ce426 TaxID=3133312 RepID=UPI003F5C1264